MDPISDRREWVLTALDQFEGRLLRYAQRLLGNLDEARDVVQFVFLQLCEQSPEKIGDRLAQWLYTVCRNRCLDLLRSSGREKSNGHVGWDKSASAADGPPRSRVAGVCERNYDPADTAEQAELHALLRTLVEHLPNNQREALDLWSDGFSYPEISRITNKQEGHIRVLVHRGLKTIREHPRVRALLSDETKPASPVHGALPNRPAAYGG